MVSVKQIVTSIAFSSLAIAASPVVTDSPEGATYIAKFSEKVEGSLEFSSTSNGSVKVDVSLSDLPSSGGPFLYHVHELPVPSDGNCTGTEGHLNPYNGSENATNPADKEVGDLSGRHGAIKGRSVNTSYIDPYISLNKDDPAFVGNLSIVVHYYNTTRIACANITEVKTSVSNGTSSSSNETTSSSASGNSSDSSSSSSTLSASSGAATISSGSWSAVILAAAAGALGALV
ncbi:hypothetical protein BZL39_P02820 [Zygosaccharomyces parabailii]|uniref:superoxide dismutase n=1 Tax=Zygosaccharomyces bailii (strain CLIB 213 / ATCC 58445 / CBS 680 / BCRC 21525 / NBRC 1098 / NCYC 1416 / NRRL Y-2227) TaxID=1333698 RepID=A0A8J2TBN8_ZYGB2|nr:hypothetical protein BZL39_H06290 [Zygosaccharomyces parabailii]AQZ19144.1 hypothetical protein BZL39_P02820 [Zygosaccharomyces parabailii]CDF91912.1 ZYBA0S15-01420g1_1 [Zygosaccharomyces bailii CLIB 213]SJM88447.1 uncharacterized protein ZBIST_4636 [Zygosaccharomyces bailii]